MAKGGFSRFQTVTADFAAKYLTPVVEAKRTGKLLVRSKDGVFSTVFQGFIEISDAVEALNLASKLVMLAPPRAKSIRKDHYLKFLVGAYLQEVYILEQRLSSYGKKISRLYGIPTLPPLINRLIYQPLEGIITARGAHVHAQRFSDASLDRLSTTALFKSVGHALGEDLWIDYKLAQRHWARQIKKNNAATLQLIDDYFDIMYEIVFHDGNMSWPRVQKQPSTSASTSTSMS